MSLKDDLEQAEKSEHANARGGWYKLLEGANRFRIIATPIAIYEDFQKGICYEGCGFKGSIKYLTYILDRKDGQIKLFKMPYTIFKWIAELEIDQDWSFAGFPMPYDLNITAKGAGTKEVEYSPIASPKKENVSPETLEILRSKGSLMEVIEKLQAKSKEKNGIVADGNEGIDVIEH